jgi:hypothetical protein
MALTATTVNHTRPSGSTNNSGGFDSAQTCTMSLSATSATGSSPVITASNYTFAAGDVGAYLFIQSGTNWIPGWYPITSVSGGLATINAAGASFLPYPLTFLPLLNVLAGCASTASPTSGLGTVDYSQQNAAALTLNGSTTMLSNSGASATATLTSATIVSGVNLIGNTFKITGGTNFTAGTYVVTSVVAGVSGTGTVTFNASVTTGAGTAATGAMGGSKALPSQTSAIEVAGNTLFIFGVLGNAASYPTTVDYTESGFINPPSGTTAAGPIRWMQDPFGPMPTIQSNGLACGTLVYRFYEYLYFTANGNSNGNFGILGGLSNNAGVSYCIFFLQDRAGLGAISITGSASVFGCDITGSTGTPSAQSANSFGISATGNYIIIGNRIRNVRDNGIINTSIGGTISFNTIYGCKNDSINLSASNFNVSTSVSNNTIDSGSGHGITIVGTGAIEYQSEIYNNIISNHLGTSKNAINIASGTLAFNNNGSFFIDYNCLYNNTGNYGNISAGRHDITVNPGYSSAGVDFTPTNSALQAGFPQVYLNTSSTNFPWIGAVTPKASGTYVINQTVNRYYVNEGEQ